MSFILACLIFSSSLLLAVVNADSLRLSNQQNNGLPMGIALEDESDVLYQFIQDPFHPHDMEAIALQISKPISVSFNTSGSSPLYLCELIMVTKLSKHRYMMMSEKVYDVSYHRQKQIVVLRIGYSSSAEVITLTRTAKIANCVTDMARTATFPMHTGDNGLPISLAPNGQFVSGQMDGYSNERSFVANFYNASDASWLSSSTITTSRTQLDSGQYQWITSPNDVISSQAHAACPQCIRIAGWDGVQLWFSYIDYSNYHVHLVSQAGNYLDVSWEGGFPTPVVSKTKLFIYSDENGIVSIAVYSLLDGSLAHYYEFAEGGQSVSQLIIVSPDESRVLVQRITFFLEVDVATGAVVIVGQPDTYLLGGFSLDANSWISRSGDKFLKYSWNV